MLTAIATDMSMRENEGFQAPPELASPVAQLATYAGRPLVDVDGYAAVRAALRSSPVGSRGIVVITSVGDTVSHAVNVVHHAPGVVVFLDGSIGASAKGPPTRAGCGSWRRPTG